MTLGVFYLQITIKHTNLYPSSVFDLNNLKLSENCKSNNENKSHNQHATTKNVYQPIIVNTLNTQLLKLLPPFKK